jgi:hypothetical protein
LLCVPSMVRRVGSILNCSASAGFALVLGQQSAVAMRFSARLAGTKLALLPRGGTASRTPDSEYLFWAEFPLHGGDNATEPMHRNGQY